MTELIAVLQSTLGLFLLWLIIFVLLRDYLVDRFRQELFSLRDEVFDYAASGAIDFKHPAYTFLRTSMNGMIRFAHRVSFLRVLMIPISGTEDLKEFGRRAQERWKEALSSITSPEVAVRLQQFHFRMQICLLKHLVYSSPMLLALAGVAILRYRLQGLWKALAEKFRGVEVIEAEAYDIGSR